MKGSQDKTNSKKLLSVESGGDGSEDSNKLSSSSDGQPTLHIRTPVELLKVIVVTFGSILTY